ncbi:MAG: hypothetical protein HOL01_05595 [Planctomycetaceae bacterium]|jgi:hypothetical protein|nr:hypothetical protein [Planctomycetaceae bacterium]MBT6486424.1 hypothetical protein [Planctomycetaceae bacterium]MBT6494009.1 hypothetical protein [Planctomycetaceae bacterium]
MSLINPAILFGLGLAAIPVLLHFLLRSKPKKLLFPALQLIVIRRKNNVRRMRLRHIWLLLLRILVIALLVFAITRPSLPAANYGLNRGEMLTLLAILGIAAAVYFGTVRFWRRKRLTNHDFAYRRTLLRGGTGIGLLLLSALLVAWPYKNRVLGELTAPVSNAAENVPVAAVFLFDTSLSMGYQQENKTRLERAAEVAVDHLSNLPPGSRIAVADTSNDEQILFQADLVGAKSRIDALEIHPVAVPLNVRVDNALDAQLTDREFQFVEQESIPEKLRRDSHLREVYLFTDLSAHGWKMNAARTLQDTLKEYEWANVYIIDVGILEPTNFSVAGLRLSKRVVPIGGELIVTANVDGVGKGTDSETRMLELYLEDMDGKRVKKGQQLAQRGDSIDFPIRGLRAPISRGEVRLVSSDPLEGDDVRYFTVAVRPPPQVLVVYENYSEALFWIDALAPGDLNESRARFRVTPLHVSKFQPADIAGPSVVCLVNLANPSVVIWNALGEFVEDGGGLFITAGNRRVDPVAYNRDSAQNILPGKLLARLSFTPAERLDLGVLEHPVLKKFDTVGGAAELSSVDVHRYWRVKPHKAASVVIPYSDWRTDPALLERVHGKGRVLLFTTAIGRETIGRESSEKWADLPAVTSGWPYFVLADQITNYLARQRIGTLNYTAGESVSVPLDPERPVNRYLMQKPGTFQQLPGEVAEGSESISINDADRLGNYTLVGAEKKSTFATGFSVNPDPNESDFRRLEERELNRLFGEGRFDVARDIDELTRRVSRGRLGQEVFPLVLFLVLVVFCGEHLVSNRFYKAEQEPEHQSK